MEFEISSYVSAGPIALGMLRAEVRQTLGAPVESFQKTPSSATKSDAFDTLGIHVHYDSDDRCKAIEFGSAVSEPKFSGRQLLKQPFAQLEPWLRQLDPEVRSGTEGLTSLKLGFGLYGTPASQDPESLVEGVIVFRRGYYDKTPGR